MTFARVALYPGSWCTPRTRETGYEATVRAIVMETDATETRFHAKKKMQFYTWAHVKIAFLCERSVPCKFQLHSCNLVRRIRGFEQANSLLQGQSNQNYMNRQKYSSVIPTHHQPGRMGHNSDRCRWCDQHVAYIH